MSNVIGAWEGLGVITVSRCVGDGVPNASGPRDALGAVTVSCCDGNGVCKPTVSSVSATGAEGVVVVGEVVSLGEALKGMSVGGDDGGITVLFVTVGEADSFGVAMKGMSVEGDDDGTEVSSIAVGEAVFGKDGAAVVLFGVGSGVGVAGCTVGSSVGDSDGPLLFTAEGCQEATIDGDSDGRTAGIDEGLSDPDATLAEILLVGSTACCWDPFDGSCLARIMATEVTIPRVPTMSNMIMRFLLLRQTGCSRGFENVEAASPFGIIFWAEFST